MLLPLTDRLVVDTLVAFSVAAVVVPVRVGEALGAKRLVMLSPWMKNSDAVTRSGTPRSPKWVSPASDIMFQLVPSLKKRLCWLVVALLKTLVDS